MLAPGAGMRGQGDIDVQREALQAGAARLVLLHQRGGRAEATDGLPGARAAGHPPLD